MALNAADDLCPPYDFQMERQVLRQRDANRTQREAELKQKAEAREAAERARVEAQKADAAKAETQKAEAAKAKSVAEAQAVSAKAHEEEESSSASKQTTRAKMVQAAEGALARAAAAAVLGKARVEAAAGEVAAIVKDKTETLGVSPPKPGRKSSASSQGVPGTTTSAEQQQQQQRQYPPLNNYLDFEQGLPPSNPWDTPETVHDAIQQLGGVSISAPAAGANNAASSSVPTSMPATSALPQSLRMPSALPSTLGKPQSLHDSPPSKSTLGYANATHMQQQQSQPNVPPPMRRVYDRVVKLGFRAMIVESAVWLFHGVAGGAAPSEVDHEKRRLCLSVVAWHLSPWPWTLTLLLPFYTPRHIVIFISHHRLLHARRKPSCRCQCLHSR